VNRLPPTSRYVYRLIDNDLVQRMLRSSAAVSPALDVNRGAKLVKADVSTPARSVDADNKFCYRPVTTDTMPIMGEWERDVFVAAGHGPWGITLAPGSGIVMAELILADLQGKKAPKTSADISGLSPFRFQKGKL